MLTRTVHLIAARSSEITLVLKAVEDHKGSLLLYRTSVHKGRLLSIRADCCRFMLYTCHRTASFVCLIKYDHKGRLLFDPVQQVLFVSSNTSIRAD